MTTKMNPEVKAKWTAALRSGDYTQGEGALKSHEGKYCCLGVLCDLHAKEHQGTWKNDGRSVDGYLGSLFILPDEVQAWAGCEKSNPTVMQGQKALSTLNDHGKSFAEIADIIDEQL